MKITIKNVFGNELIYPADDTAQHFCDLIRQKTFTERDIAIIRKLGYPVEVSQARSTLADRIAHAAQ